MVFLSKPRANIIYPDGVGDAEWVGYSGTGSREGKYTAAIEITETRMWKITLNL